MIHAFAPDSGGTYPASSVVLLKNKLYGTTSSYGDADCSCGTVFAAGLDGSYTVLHAFTGYNGGHDGSAPYAGLSVGPHHYLYGDTYQGGTDAYGTVFQLKPPKR